MIASGTRTANAPGHEEANEAGSRVDWRWTPAAAFATMTDARRCRRADALSLLLGFLQHRADTARAVHDGPDQAFGTWLTAERLAAMQDHEAADIAADRFHRQLRRLTAGEAARVDDDIQWVHAWTAAADRQSQRRLRRPG